MAVVSFTAQKLYTPFKHCSTPEQRFDIRFKPENQPRSAQCKQPLFQRQQGNRNRFLDSSLLLGMA